MQRRGIVREEGVKPLCVFYFEPKEEDATEEKAKPNSRSDRRCGTKGHDTVRRTGGLWHCGVCLDVVHATSFRQGGISLHCHGGGVAGGVCGVSMGVSEDKVGKKKRG